LELNNAGTIHPPVSRNLEIIMDSNTVLPALLKTLLLSCAAMFHPTVSAACISSETESNNTDATANYALCSGTAVTGAISSSTDVDWLKFDVGSTGTLTINLSHASSADFDLYLYKATGSYVASAASSANPAVISYNATTTGPYFIKITRYAGTGAWTLNLSTATTPPPSTGNRKVWLNGGAISQSNTAIFVGGLRQATGKNTGTPNINSTSNCDENWNTTACPRVAVITAAALNQIDGVDKYTNDLGGQWSYANLFRRHGFAPKHILSHWDTYANNSINTTTQGQANIAIINQADLVYVIGGDQSRLSRTFLKDDGSDTALMAAMRTRFNAGTLIYAGDSAGTAIAPAMSYGEGISIGYLNQNTLRQITPASCPYNSSGDSCLINPDTSHPDYGTKIKGFGFITNAIVDTHFDNRSGRTGRLGRMVAALKNIGTGAAYGIDQNTAFYLNGDLGTVYGTGAVFIAEAASSNFPSSTNFSASNVRLSYLTSGDSYQRSTGVIGTSKTIITTPRYSGFLDSTNIFAVSSTGLGNTTLTFTRLADQTGTSNIGVAPADSAFGNPLSFDVIFKKDASTQAYKSGTSGPYTIKKALLDIE
jgi:cyanophycinase